MPDAGGRASFEHHLGFIGRVKTDINFWIVIHYGLPCRYRLPTRFHIITALSPTILLLIVNFYPALYTRPIRRAFPGVLSVWSGMNYLHMRTCQTDGYSH